MSETKDIPDDSPAGRYLTACRRAQDYSLQQHERHAAYEEANRYALSFGYRKTAALDALLARDR